MTTRPANSLKPSRAIGASSWSPRRWCAHRPSPEPGINDRRAASASPLTIRPDVALNQLAEVPGAFSLRGLLICGGCDQPLRPVITPAGARGYRSACECRPHAVDAAVVEQLVRDAVERSSAALVDNAPPAALGEMFRALFAAVRIGSSVEDLSPIWRF